MVSLLRDNGLDCVCVCDSDRILFDCKLDVCCGAEDLVVGADNIYISLVVLSKLVEPNVILFVKTDDKPANR